MAKLLIEASLSRAAFKNSNLFKNRMSLVVVNCGPVDILFASKKDPLTENGSDIFALSIL